MTCLLASSRGNEMPATQLIKDRREAGCLEEFVFLGALRSDKEKGAGLPQQLSTCWGATAQVPSAHN